MTIYQPYTYLIGWSKYNKFYYGARYATGCNPNDLWKTYFTSSKYVKEYRKIYGEPDIIQIRKVFNNSDDAIKWESRLLERIKASSRSDFLNQQNGSGYKGVVHDDEMKKVKSEKMKIYWTEEKRNKKSQDMMAYNKIYGTQRYSENMYKRYANTEFKDQFTEKMNIVNKCIDKRKKAGEKIKLKWKDPNYNEKMKTRNGGRKKISVNIDGINYESISEAVNKTNLSYHSIRKIAGLVK